MINYFIEMSIKLSLNLFRSFWKEIYQCSNDGYYQAPLVEVREGLGGPGTENISYKIFRDGQSNIKTKNQQMILIFSQAFRRENWETDMKPNNGCDVMWCDHMSNKPPPGIVSCLVCTQWCPGGTLQTQDFSVASHLIWSACSLSRLCRS